MQTIPANFAPVRLIVVENGKQNIDGLFVSDRPVYTRRRTIEGHEVIYELYEAVLKDEYAVFERRSVVCDKVIVTTEENLYAMNEIPLWDGKE